MTRPPPAPGTEPGRPPPPPPIDDGEEGDDALIDDEAMGLLIDDEADGNPLDDATSERDPIDSRELDVDLEEGEDVDWREGTDDAAELETGEGPGIGQEEYGWTADVEAQGVEAGDDVLAELGEPPPSTDDEDGDAEPDLDAGDVLELRPVRDLADDEGDEGLDLEGEDEVGGSLSYEQEARMMGASLPEPSATSAERVTWIGPDGGVTALATGPDGVAWCVGDDDVYRFDGRRFVAARIPSLVALGPTSVAVHPRVGTTIVVGTALGGAFVSSDSGNTWRELSGWRGEGEDGAMWVAFEGTPEGGRLWGRTRGGRLVCSDDVGETWSDVGAGAVRLMAACALGGVAVIVARGDGSPLVRWSHDGGRAWREAELPALRGELDAGLSSLALGNDRIAVGLEGAPDGLWTIDVATAATCPWPWPSPSALELCASGALWVATFLPAIDRGLVVRDPDVADAREVVIDVGAARQRARLPRPPEGESEGRVTALRDHVAGLLVATSVGVFRVDRDPGRE